VSPSSSSAPALSPPASSSVAVPPGDSIAANGSIVERVVPDDNSCLFRSVAGVVFNDSTADPAPLRRICSSAVAEDPALYSTDMLQMTNPQYCNWILKETSWGGPIELAILSAHFGVELSAVDIKSMHSERYGEGQHGTVGFLMYDGLHYNYVALVLGAGIPDIVQFDSTDAYVVERARSLAQAKHSSGKFTDVHSFRLRCKVCTEIVLGEKGAQEHGEKTSHVEFEEVN
jgi:ubiquitin thioesterase OTU1